MRKILAGGVVAVLMSVAPVAQAACTFGQNLVSITNEALTIVDVPVKAHAQWRVGDSASGWVDLPFNTAVQRAYGVDYPLFVDVTLFNGLRWFSLDSVNVLPVVQEYMAEYSRGRNQCVGMPNAPARVQTQITLKLSDGYAGTGVLYVDVLIEDPQ